MRDNANKKRYLNRITDKISSNQIKSEIAVELDAHIDERAQFYEEIGYSEEEAFEKAVEQMGDPDAVGTSLSRLHPQGRKSVSVMLSVLLFVLLILAWRFFFLFTVFNGAVGSVLCENILLLCFIGISWFGYKIRNIFLSVLSPIAFLLTYGVYAWLFYRGNMQCTEFAALCSPSILCFYCVCTGDFLSLKQITEVGGVTVAPWLTYASVLFYVLILLLMIFASFSAQTLSFPSYSLSDKRTGKRVSHIEKVLCILLVFVTGVSVFVWKGEDCKLSQDQAQFTHVVILQSDTPCSVEDLNSEDCSFFYADYELFGDYIPNWRYVSPKEKIMNCDSKLLTVFCNKSMSYQVRKATLECLVDKPYVSVMFIKCGFSRIDDFDYVREFFPETLEWQESSSVGTVSATVDAYNCVDVIINVEA